MCNYIYLWECVCDRLRFLMRGWSKKVEINKQTKRKIKQSKINNLDFVAPQNNNNSESKHKMGVSTAIMSVSGIEYSCVEKADGIYLSDINISRSKKGSLSKARQAKTNTHDLLKK